MVVSDIENRVNYYFRRILSSPPSDEILNIFRRLHASPMPRHQKIVCCMLKHLIAKFQLFATYPLSELFKIANLVGGFLEHGLISDKNTLTTVVEYIFYDLKNGSANAFNFSLAALKRFKMQLKNFPKFCYRLQSIKDFKNFPSDLVECINYGVDGLEPPHQQVTNKKTLTSTDDNEEVTESQNVIVHVQLQPTPEPPAITTVVADVLPTPEPLATTKASAYASPTPEPSTTTKEAADESPKPESPTITKAPADASPTPETSTTTKVAAHVRIIAPSKTVQGEIRSIINYLSGVNLQTMVRKIKDLIADEHLPWFARYIVTKRVRHEFNFHDLYSSVLDCFDSEELNSLVLMETLKKIRILLRRNEGIPSVADKWLIKNLGHWLGVITLARNRPIRKEDIDLERLLAEAYDEGDEELLFVVHFVTRVLESCSAGDFGPESPWTTSITGCLFELYAKRHTKLQVKVEIEKLCKALNIKLRVKQ